MSEYVCARFLSVFILAQATVWITICAIHYSCRLSPVPRHGVFTALTQAAVAAAAVAAVVCATCVHVHTPNGPATKRVQATMLGSAKCTARGCSSYCLDRDLCHPLKLSRGKCRHASHAAAASAATLTPGMFPRRSHLAYQRG